ncbi:MAG: hypothetical protein VX871_01310 [Pseudomonadota bacterium]|nr:hypothetical protein [Pseudomonadota bacterium]
MNRHRAYGKSPEQLHVAVVDARRGMGQVLHSALMGLGVVSIDCYENSSEALGGLIESPADVIFVRDNAEPIDGYLFCELLRRNDMGPSMDSGVIMMATQIRRRQLEKSLTAGAHQVMVLPVSPVQLERRLRLLCSDERQFKTVACKRVIDGASELVTQVRMAGLLGSAAPAMLHDNLASAPSDVIEI